MWVPYFVITLYQIVFKFSALCYVVIYYYAVFARIQVNIFLLFMKGDSAIRQFVMCMYVKSLGTMWCRLGWKQGLKQAFERVEV